MSDYIDRQAAIEALRRAEALTRAFGYHNVIETIREMPSADVEPVVRCKACANWNRETHGCLRNPSVSPWWEDDFCNYGARMDGEQDG